MNWEAHGEAHGEAPPEAVWRVLADGPRWFEWNEAVEWLWFEDGVRSGALATMKPKGFRQTAFLITAAAAPHELALQITVGPAARLAFVWTLSPKGTGTRITETVAVDG
ncbi:MAG: SRPBCC family protein, partial [Candidatus Velthaea sp.]